MAVGPIVQYDVDAQGLAHDERLLALYRLWDSKRRGRLLPARSDFDHAELAPWFGNLILLDVLEGGKDFHYRLFGVTLAVTTITGIANTRRSWLASGAPARSRSTSIRHRCR